MSPPPVPSPLSLSCRFLLTLFVSPPFFPHLTVLTKEEIVRLFDFRIDTPMRGSEQSETRTTPLTYEFPFDSHRDAILSVRSESHADIPRYSGNRSHFASLQI